jgi:large subunit ribosomal protein L29
MELKELRTQSAQDLAEQLVELRREQFNLRMQKGSGQQKQTHHFKRVKREIAQVKMLIGEKTPSAAKGEK